LKKILLSNDDGVHAPGIRALAAVLAATAEVTVVAPLTEQSATSHALTLHRPLRIKELEPRVLAVEGTPTDCVLLALKKFLPEPPDLVVSGVNQGPNMGEDVLYSGTVAAAMEGALLGVPSVAFSLASWRSREFEAAARLAARLTVRLLERTLPRRFLLNVNLPPRPEGEVKGYRFARLGSRVYHDAVVRKVDPRGREYYWIGGAEPTWTETEASDFAAVEAGYVALTPLLLDLTGRGGFHPVAGLEGERP